jgi:RNA polymerase sigma factor for flagellar operon FliA
MHTDPRSLWQAFHQLKDPASRTELVEHYMPLARIIAAKVYGLRYDSCSSFDDYLQYARLGLIEAVDRYDSTRGASFETFSAYRIRGAILNGLANSSEAAAQRSFWRSRGQAVLESLQDNLPVPPEKTSLDELADLTVELAIGLVLIDRGTESADEAPGSNPYAATELAQFSRLLRDLIRQLPQREREVIESHYFDHVEFHVLAERYSISKGRVSQLHSRALARLREMMRDQPKVDTKL